MSTFKVIFCYFLGLAALFNVEARCKCEQQKIHYEELGCKPVFDKPGDCCPSHYDCEDILTRSLNLKEGCIVKGVTYANGQSIDSSLTLGNCRAACHCNGNRLICAHVDCAEFFGAFPLAPGCFRAYKPNTCCSSGTVCPPFDNLEKCEVGGKTYYEGQRFNPEEDKCQSCVCQKGFKGELEEPFCRKVSCDFEPKTYALKDNCAPVFYGTKTCCPIRWDCKKEDDKQDFGKALTHDADKTKSCLFGKRMLKIGEKIDTNPVTSCECVIPPLMTCVQKPK